MPEGNFYGCGKLYASDWLPLAKSAPDNGEVKNPREIGSKAEVQKKFEG